MAPMKFEENIRERLEQRELKPSVKAWERIERELDASAKRKTKKGYGWLLVAAGFIGILILAGKFVFTTDVTPQNQVVETAVEQNTRKTDTEEEGVVPGVTEPSTVEQPLVHTDKPVEQKLTPMIQKPVPVDQKDQVVEVSQEQPVLEAPVQKQIDAEVDALLAKVQEQDYAGVAYSDAEIDKLLRDAQRDIISDQLFNKERNTVSAEALLYEVEEELDPSFRDRIFEALKAGFLKAREAVASRND